MAVPILVAIYVLAFAAAAIRSQIVLGRQSALTWEELLASLRPVRTEGLMEAASPTYISTCRETRAEFKEMLTAIGGSEGLKRIQTNALVFMALAGYIEMWSVDANADEIELMRKDGVKLRRMATMLGVIIKCFSHRDLALYHLSGIARLYCGMVERLLTLCAVAHVGRYPALVAAVNW